MTEEEWLTPGDSRAPEKMLAVLAGRFAPRPVNSHNKRLRRRKLLLFGVAACRDRQHLLLKPDTRALLDLIECKADGTVGHELRAARERSMQAARPTVPGEKHAAWHNAYDNAEYAIHLLAHNTFSSEGALFLQNLCSASEFDPYSPLAPEGRLCQLLRDIFGNPFRPVVFDPAWRTDTAVALARTMYDSREFGAMPILADALQDAGCEDEQVLNHCRDATAPHVRGCWVVDLVLSLG